MEFLPKVTPGLMGKIEEIAGTTPQKEVSNLRVLSHGFGLSSRVSRVGQAAAREEGGQSCTSLSLSVLIITYSILDASDTSYYITGSRRKISEAITRFQSALTESSQKENNGIDGTIHVNTGAASNLSLWMAGMFEDTTKRHTQEQN